MRIAVLTNYHLDQVGGAEEALDQLASYWQATGHDVTLLASPRRRPGPSRNWRPAYPVVELLPPWSTRFGLAKYVRPLSALHRQRPLDVVLASDAYWPGHVALLFRRQTGVPYCLYSHGSDVMHGSRFLRRAVCRRRLEQSIASAAGIACISDYMRRRIEEIARPTGLVRVIPNGWPDAWQETASAEGDRRSATPAPARYVFALGRIVESKGFQTLVEAFALMRRRRPDLADVGLVIAGDGPYRQELIARAQAFGLAPSADWPRGSEAASGVILPGTVQGAQKRALIDGAELGVCPSIRQEPQGMVVLEMLCRGVPVLASRNGGLPEHILPGRNGQLFEPSSATDLAARLEEMLAWPGGRENWSRRARDSVRLLGWSQVAEAHLRLLEDSVAAFHNRPAVARPHFLRRWLPAAWRQVAPSQGASVDKAAN